MASRIPDMNPVIDAMPGRTVPGIVRGLGALGIAWGVAGIGYALATGNAVWLWGAFLVALIFTMSLAQGGVVFAVIMTLVRGHWGGPVKRVAESFAFFLPFAYLMLLVMLFLGNGLYPWHEGTFHPGGVVDLKPHSPAAEPSKELYFQMWFWWLRQAGGVALLFALDFMYLRASFGPDMARVKARFAETGTAFTAPGWWSMVSGTTDPAQGEKTRGLFAAFIALAYPLVFSFLAFDMVMSLAPWWYANMFGVWNFVSGFWLALCGITVTLLISKEWLGISKYIGSNIPHDLGKLILAGSMFWAYTTYAQLLPIWYANMPEETDFLLIRLHLPEWAWLARTVGVLCFVMPFTVLLSRGIKKMRWPFVGLLVTIMVGIFLERTLQVMPSVWLNDTFPTDLFLITSLGMLGMFLGVFVLIVSEVLSKLPPLVLTDSLMGPHPWDEHVHSLDAHHHH